MDRCSLLSVPFSLSFSVCLCLFSVCLFLPPLSPLASFSASRNGVLQGLRRSVPGVCIQLFILSRPSCPNSHSRPQRRSGTGGVVSMSPTRVLAFNSGGDASFLCLVLHTRNHQAAWMALLPTPADHRGGKEETEAVGRCR